nr:glycosyltransferase family 4 protein [Solirubrobacterales bacterium]
VALNAAFLAPGESGGPEVYLRGLLPALAEAHPRTRFTLITTRRGAAALRLDGWEDFCRIEALEADDGNRRERLTAETLGVPGAARRVGAQVLHSLASAGPPIVFGGVRHVATLHDVTFLRMPTFPRATTLAMGGLMLGVGHGADGLITGSAAAGREIGERLHIPFERFTVVHHGPGRPPSSVALSPEETRQRHALPPEARIVLCVGAKRPHKNQLLLVEALPHLEGDVVLVLAGHAESYVERLRARAEELGVSGRLRLPDYVEDEELEGLWSLAGATGAAALPTLGEGFGLPVLEALGRGVPLACSDLDVLREVGGELLSTFDPHDPRSAAAAITAVLGDRELGARGPARAAQFSWERAARETYAVYERAWAGG